MAVKLVVTRDEVRERYSLENRQDINDALDSALRSAHLFFQGSLGTEWDEVLGQTDVFYLNRDLFPVFPNQQFRFRLKRGFVRQSPAVVVKYAVRRRELTDAAVYTILDSSFYTVDYDKGLVCVDDDFLDSSGVSTSVHSTEGNRFFAITYSAGFDNEIVVTPGQADGTPAVITAATYLPPDWLKEAILVWMGSVLATAGHSENPSAGIQAAEKIKNQAEDMIVTKKRETAFQFLPVS